MKCPKCSIRLKCFDTRPLDNDKRIRTYACTKCDVTYYSMETLDHEPLRIKVPPRVRKRGL